jgi:hypothetical protein
MGEQQNTNNLPQVTIILEILSEEADEADLGMMYAIKRDTVEALQRDGYRIQPVSTGQRGGDLIVEVITTVTNIAATVWANKEAVERGINDAGALVTIFGGIVPVIQHFAQSHQKRAGQANNLTSPIKITIEIDGFPMTFEVADVKQAEAVMKLAQQFHTSHPTIAARVTPQSKIKVTGTIPKKQQRKRK